MFEVSKYSNYELTNTIRDDAYAVRDEAAKRSDAIAKRIASAKAKLAKLEAENRELFAIHAAALVQIGRDQEMAA